MARASFSSATIRLVSGWSDTTRTRLELQTSGLAGCQKLSSGLDARYVRSARDRRHRSSGAPRESRRRTRASAAPAWIGWYRDGPGWCKNDHPLRWIAIHARRDLSERFAFLDRVVGAAGLCSRCSWSHDADESKQNNNKQKVASEGITVRVARILAPPVKRQSCYSSVRHDDQRTNRHPKIEQLKICQLKKQTLEVFAELFHRHHRRVTIAANFGYHAFAIDESDPQHIRDCLLF
jgi:hypothetical protein